MKNIKLSFVPSKELSTKLYEAENANKAVSKLVNDRIKILKDPLYCLTIEETKELKLLEYWSKN